MANFAALPLRNEIALWWIQIDLLVKSFGA
jgi:hypothetical protein